MSLTHLVDTYKDVMDKIAPPPPVPLLVSDEYAPPQTSHYSLVGTAFDYAMRAYLERLNRGVAVKMGSIVATAAAHPTYCKNKKSRTHRSEFLALYHSELEEYVAGARPLTDLLPACIALAKMDVVYRTGVDTPDDKIFSYDNRDVDDLSRLVELISPLEFKVSKRCLLNPTFAASLLVGGADADIILDTTLIDIKTTKYLRFNVGHWRQLIGYYLLDKLTLPEESHGIDEVGIYYSRHGVLWTIKPDLRRSAVDVFTKLVLKYSELGGLYED